MNEYVLIMIPIIPIMWYFLFYRTHKKDMLKTWYKDCGLIFKNFYLIMLIFMIICSFGFMYLYSLSNQITSETVTINDLKIWTDNKLFGSNYHALINEEHEVTMLNPFSLEEGDRIIIYTNGVGERWYEHLEVDVI